MQLSCSSFLCNKLFQKNRFWVFQHFQPPPLILRKNEGIMSAPCSAIKQTRSRGILNEFYTPPSTIMPSLKVWGRHFSPHIPLVFPNLHTKKARHSASQHSYSFWGMLRHSAPLQGGLSTSHDACWSQTRQSDDLSPRGFVCLVSCVHLLRSFCEPCGSGRFLRGCDEAVCLQARCVFQALLL